ncbi:hypothetical protein LCGC14_1610960 [marine sediment metagenome]|uniref:Uncharacterized protein n=1 Tax=marine sediment metagenome TaxID=412755 RepID=A0A0F9L8G9_9ZZZZ
MASNWKTVSTIGGRPVPENLKFIALTVQKDGGASTPEQLRETLAIAFTGRNKAVKVRELIETMDAIGHEDNEAFAAALAAAAAAQSAADSVGEGSVSL